MGIPQYYRCWYHITTDSSIISISTYCTGLQSLNLSSCDQITDASIKSISVNCTGLQSVNLERYYQSSDASSENCTGLNELNISHNNITYTSLIVIAKNCTVLQSLDTNVCNRLSNDVLCHSFKSVSELRAVLLSIQPFPPRLTSISSCAIH